MTYERDIQRKLAALATDRELFSEGERVISQGGLPSPLQAILKEIDETVIAQDLVIAFGDHGTLTLSVSGRRLLGVRAIDSLAMPGIIEQIVEKPVSHEDNGAMRALGGVLLQFDLLTDDVSVKTEAASALGGQSNTGLSVERLADLLSVEYPFAVPTRLSHFLSKLSPKPESYVYKDLEGELRENGAEDALETLRSVVEKAQATVTADGAATKLSTIGHQSEPGEMLAVASDGIEILAWWLETQDLVGAFGTWRQIFGE